MSLWILVLHLTMAYTCNMGLACPASSTTERILSQHFSSLDACERKRAQIVQVQALSQVTEIEGVRLERTVTATCQERK